MDSSIEEGLPFEILQNRLNGYLKNKPPIEEGLPFEILNQSWVNFPSVDGGFINLISSKYLLLPAEISKILVNDLLFDISSKDVKKTCYLRIEKSEGRHARVKLIYDFDPMPTWR